MKIKKKMTSDEYNMFSEKLHNLAFVNRSSNAFYQPADDFKNRNNSDLVHNHYSQSSLTKIPDSIYMKTSDMSLQLKQHR